MKQYSFSLLCLIAAGAAAGASTPVAWPHVQSAIRPDAAIERRVESILAGMSLEQKVGQMTQGEIKSVTPDDVRRYYLGSVLNGGGSWPGGNKHATAADWLALSQRYYEASLQTDMAVKVPVIWGTDAVHGHSNVVGATLFPHNIGLGAAHDPQLIEAIGASVGRAVRATGIQWVFAPTVAVVRDDRWGRTYEGFAEDSAMLKEYGAAYVRGMQGDFSKPHQVVATVKHFIGDGGTSQGKDRGVNQATEADMLRLHAQGYVGALGAGAQTVMASFNSWNDVTAGVNYGKVHGSRALLTGLLKEKLGFDGFVVSDWDGIAEVAGCRSDSCPQAINAGIDMIMVPDAWKAFIANTVAQVRKGDIPMGRIDDAVRRILRVKLRSGLFDRAPAANSYAGKQEALQDKALVRRAVRESLVLLKNEGPTLPLARTKHLLVVGRAADDMSSQSGGWSLTWQGTDNTRADFPQAQTILEAIRASGAKTDYSVDGANADVSKYDAVIAVIGERPYAEGDGDIGPGASLRHSSRYPQDLALLRAVSGKGKPVLTVFLSGRPLYVNDLLNLSDVFIAAWLPGTESAGLSDMLIAGAQSADFRGRLSFSWPRTPCQTPLNVGDHDYAPLFAYGYGLRAKQRSHLGQLPVDASEAGCGNSNAFAIHGQADRLSFPLYLRSGDQSQALGLDLNATVELPAVRAATTQVVTQQDAKLITWSGPATFEARGERPLQLPDAVRAKGVLSVDVIVPAAPQQHVWIAMGDAELDATAMFRRMAGQGRRAVRIPLSCFAARGADLAALRTPFRVRADASFAAAFANIGVLAVSDADVESCEVFQ